MGDTWQATLAMDNEPPAIVAQRLANSHARIREAPALILLCLYTADLDHYPDSDRQAAETTMAIQSLGAAAQNDAPHRLSSRSRWRLDVRAALLP